MMVLIGCFCCDVSSILWCSTTNQNNVLSWIFLIDLYCKYFWYHTSSSWKHKAMNHILTTIWTPTPLFFYNFKVYATSFVFFKTSLSFLLRIITPLFHIFLTEPLLIFPCFSATFCLILFFSLFYVQELCSSSLFIWCNKNDAFCTKFSFYWFQM